MPNWAIYRTADNRVKEYIVSSPIDPIYPVRAGEVALKDPDVSSLKSIPIHYWKHSVGALVEMTQAEKDTVDAEDEANRIASLKQFARDLFTNDTANARAFRALLYWTLERINELRALPVIGLGGVSRGQAKIDIAAKISSGDAEA